MSTFPDRAGHVETYVEHDLAYLYLLARGISHWRLEMTDPDGMVPPEVTIHIHESNDNA